MLLIAQVQTGLAEFRISQQRLTSPSGRDLKYVLYVPGNAPANVRHSLLIALYGHGGSIAHYNFADPAFKDLRDKLDRRGVVVVVPDLGRSHFMNDQAMQDLDDLLNELAKNPRIDAQHIHLLGTSMGGGSALAYALHQPMRIRSVISHMGMTDFAIWAKENHDFETLLSSAYGGTPNQVPDAYRTRSALERVDQLRQIPVMLIHGNNDGSVSSSHSVNLHHAIQAAKGTSVLKIVEGGKHENTTMSGLGSEVVSFLVAAEEQSKKRLASPVQPDRTRSVLQRRTLQTPQGTSFGILGDGNAEPAPTLFILASTPEDSLGNEYFLQCGLFLAKQGYLCVSLDLPCHGQDRRAGEPEGLAGWRSRVDADEPLMNGFISRAQNALDFLIAKKLTDPEHVAVCGTSRGGFAALHLAAVEPRIRYVVAMAPVTQLNALEEFQNMSHPEKAELLSVNRLAERLVDRGLWIAIGDQDRRVDTDAAIAFARHISELSVKKRVTSNVNLLVLAEPGGHTTPSGAAALSADWITKQFAGKNSGAKR